jgi:hypothetical protein
LEYHLGSDLPIPGWPGSHASGVSIRVLLGMGQADRDRSSDLMRHDSGGGCVLVVRHGVRPPQLAAPFNRQRASLGLANNLDTSALMVLEAAKRNGPSRGVPGGTVSMQMMPRHHFD